MFNVNNNFDYYCNINVMKFQLIFKYLLFVILAILANLSTQRLVLCFDDTYIFLILAIIAGTFVGLLIKYVLDKRWIFNDRSNGFRTHGKKFSRYTAMGTITTLIFWCSEALFWYVWKSDFMREIGAILGLSLGYYIKYHLDRKYVFNGMQQREIT